MVVFATSLLVIAVRFAFVVASLVVAVIPVGIAHTVIPHHIADAIITLEPNRAKPFEKSLLAETWFPRFC